MEFESKLTPILREGVEIVKLIFFKDLQKYLSKEFPDQEKAHINKLAGAVINRFFGIVNQEEEFVAFTNEHDQVIEGALSEVGVKLENLLQLSRRFF